MSPPPRRRRSLSPAAPSSLPALLCVGFVPPRLLLSALRGLSAVLTAPDARAAFQSCCCVSLLSIRSPRRRWVPTSAVLRALMARCCYSRVPPHLLNSAAHGSPAAAAAPILRAALVELS